MGSDHPAEAQHLGKGVVTTPKAPECGLLLGQEPEEPLSEDLGDSGLHLSSDSDEALDLEEIARRLIDGGFRLTAKPRNDPAVLADKQQRRDAFFQKRLERGGPGFLTSKQAPKLPSEPKSILSSKSISPPQTEATIWSAFPGLRRDKVLVSKIRERIREVTGSCGGFYFPRPIPVIPVVRKHKYHRMNFGDEEVRFDGSVDGSFRLYDVWFLPSGKEMGRNLVMVVRDLFRRELMGSLPLMDRQGRDDLLEGPVLLEHLVWFRHHVLGAPIELMGGSKLQITCRPSGRIVASWTWGTRNAKF